jgi:hypothetical protein
MNDVIMPKTGLHDWRFSVNLQSLYPVGVVGIGFVTAWPHDDDIFAA